MRADDERYDPCCARCMWSDSYYWGPFWNRLCCCIDAHRIRPVRPEHVCEKYEEES